MAPASPREKSGSTAKKIETLSYEAAYKELEGIVTALETEEHSLEESLSLYERGQVLSAYCAGLLEKAELKVRQLDAEGRLDLEG